ncbi:MAG: hypothetical protein RR066_04785 [Mucinivorans sp.]
MKYLLKYLSIIKYILLIVSAIFVVLGVTSDDNVGMMLNWSYLMLFITIGLAVIMPMFGIAQNPKSAMKSLIGIALVALVFFVSWALSEATPIKLANGSMLTNPGELIFSDMALWSTYIMFVGVIISIVFGEIYKLFK